MRLGKKTSRAISIALLAAMASTSLPQVDILAAVRNGMFLSVSYTDKDENNNNIIIKKGLKIPPQMNLNNQKAQNLLKMKRQGLRLIVVFKKILKNKHLKITRTVHQKILLPTQILPEKLHIIMDILLIIIVMTVHRHL